MRKYLNIDIPREIVKDLQNNVPNDQAKTGVGRGLKANRHFQDYFESEWLKYFGRKTAKNNIK